MTTTLPETESVRINPLPYFALWTGILAIPLLGEIPTQPPYRPSVA